MKDDFSIFLFLFLSQSVSNKKFHSRVFSKVSSMTLCL